MGALIAVGSVVIISLIGLLAVFIWSNICYRRALKMSEEIEEKYRGLYEELLAKVKRRPSCMIGQDRLSQPENL